MNGIRKGQSILSRIGKRIDDGESWRTQQVIDNRFRVLSQIGYGTFGKVYEAVDTRTSDRVAVKVFNSDFENSGYLQELGLLFGQKHSNIVDVLSFGYSRGQKYLVYEFVEGGSLRDYMVRYGRVGVTVALQLAIQLVEGLEFAHNHKIVHRDLKPENILLTHSEWPFTVKICDFGLAARCAGEERLSSSFGSTAYMAPEQFHKNYDARVDLYAVGVILYEMLFGRRPFGGDAASILYAHQHVDVALPEHGPSGLLDLLKKALAKSPEDRFQDCEEMLTALRWADKMVAEESREVQIAAPQRCQPELKQRWETLLPFQASRFSVTHCGKLSFSGRDRIFTVERTGKFRQIFRGGATPDLLIEGGDMERVFGWVEGNQCKVWEEKTGIKVFTLDEGLVDQPIRLLFSPREDRLLLVSSKLLILYTLDGEVCWRAEISTYGFLPPATFSSCGRFVWVATDSPQTRLICLSLEGEAISRTAAGHHEVELMGHLDGGVLVGEKDRHRLVLLNPDGFVAAEAKLTESLYSLMCFDQSIVLVNSINHFELIDMKTLETRGFINVNDPFDLFFGVEGGFFQIAEYQSKCRIRYTEVRYPSSPQPLGELGEIAESSGANV